MKIAQSDQYVRLFRYFAYTSAKRIFTLWLDPIEHKIKWNDGTYMCTAIRFCSIGISFKASACKRQQTVCWCSNFIMWKLFI